MTTDAKDTKRMAYSLDETAAALGVSRETVRHKIADGGLRAVKVNRRVLVPAAELERFLAGSPK